MPAHCRLQDQEAMQLCCVRSSRLSVSFWVQKSLQTRCALCSPYINMLWQRLTCPDRQHVFVFHKHTHTL